jgi:transcriptional regulator with XRE-family HTH domain
VQNKIAAMFNKRFKKMRLKRGWTLPETAKRIGVSVDTIATYQRDATPHFKHLVKIARAFDISLQFLITGKEDEQKEAMGDFATFKKYFNEAAVGEKEKVRKFVVSNKKNNQ